MTGCVAELVLFVLDSAVFDFEDNKYETASTKVSAC
jgi:hypothetical protein